MEKKKEQQQQWRAGQKLYIKKHERQKMWIKEKKNEKSAGWAMGFYVDVSRKNKNPTVEKYVSLHLVYVIYGVLFNALTISLFKKWIVCFP